MKITDVAVTGEDSLTSAASFYGVYSTRNSDELRQPVQGGSVVNVDTPRPTAEPRQQQQHQQQQQQQANGIIAHTSSTKPPIVNGRPPYPSPPTAVTVTNPAGAMSPGRPVYKNKNVSNNNNDLRRPLI